MGLTENIEKNKIVEHYIETPSFEKGVLNIEISGRCNERCVYCPYSAGGMHEKSGFIDPEFFYRITKEARNLGVSKIGLYMRGEPLCNPKIYEYVHYLKHELGYEYVYISTNGLLLNQDNMEKLAKAGIDSIKFSVAGYDRNSFIQHHGVDGYDLVNKNIEYAHSYRENNGYSYLLGMFIIVTSYNIKHVEKMKSYYGKYCDEIISDYVINEGPIRVKGLELLMNDGKSNDMIDKSIPCKDLFNRIAIDEKGYLLTCCYSIDGYTRVIDLSNISLEEGVYSGIMKNIRRRHINNDIVGTVCEKCLNCNTTSVMPFDINIDGCNKELKDVEYREEIKERFGI